MKKQNYYNRSSQIKIKTQPSLLTPIKNAVDQEDTHLSLLSSLSSPTHNHNNTQTFSQGRLETCEIIGNFMNSFIILHNQGRLYMVDQHAASEKCLYINYLRENLCMPYEIQESKSQAGFKQLNIPNFLKEILAQPEKRIALKRRGWDYRILSEGPIWTSVRLKSVPSIFGRIPDASQFIEIVEQIYNEDNDAYSKSQKNTLASIACHNALRVGDQLSKQEMMKIIDSLYLLKVSAFNCPHGRPIINGLSEPKEYFTAATPQQYSLL